MGPFAGRGSISGRVCAFILPRLLADIWLWILFERTWDMNESETVACDLGRISHEDATIVGGTVLDYISSVWFHQMRCKTWARWPTVKLQLD